MLKYYDFSGSHFWLTKDSSAKTANFDLWGVAEKRRKKKKEKKEKERKKKVFTLKIRFQNYTFF
jgi:hypothetical protein